MLNGIDGVYVHARTHIHTCCHWHTYIQAYKQRHSSRLTSFESPLKISGKMLFVQFLTERASDCICVCVCAVVLLSLDERARVRVCDRQIHIVVHVCCECSSCVQSVTAEALIMIMIIIMSKDLFLLPLFFCFVSINIPLSLIPKGGSSRGMPRFRELYPVFGKSVTIYGVYSFNCVRHVDQTRSRDA